MNGMVPRDIASMTQAGEVRVSPDGARVAFSVISVDLDANDYRSRIWVGPADGSSPPYPFTSGDGKDVLPRWSPDGNRLAFVSDRTDRRQDVASSEVVVLPVTVGGQPVKAAVISEEVSELEWSPDASRIGFVARDPDQSRYGPPGSRTPEADMPPRRIDHLFYRLDTAGWTFDRPNRVFVVAADGSCPPIALTTGPFEASHLTWSPDGRRLAFVSARHESWDLDLATDLWWTAADASAQPEKLTETAAQFSHPAWSPDGTRLACLRTPSVLDEPRHTQVVVIDVATREAQELSGSLDRTCAPFGGTRSPVWDRDDIVFTVEDSGNVHLYRAPSAGDAKPELVVGGCQTISSWNGPAGRSRSSRARRPIWPTCSSGRRGES